MSNASESGVLESVVDTGNISALNTTTDSESDAFDEVTVMRVTTTKDYNFVYIKL